MKRYTDFDEAADAYMHMGGAMNYDGGGWWHGPHGAIAEMVNDNDAKAATIQALRAGGWTKEAIDEQMRDWQD